MPNRRSIAVYPGMFDPITNGHADIVRRALKLFDRVVVALADNPRKRPLFSCKERKRMIHETLANDVGVEVDSFSGLLVEYVRRRGARFVIRGLRAVADFEYEFQFAHMNRQLAPEVETIFLMTNEDNFFVSSSLVREVAEMGGDIGRVVPPVVLSALKKKLKKPR
jgi:pantetheine-phosphate adenylyltransferase